MSIRPDQTSPMEVLARIYPGYATASREQLIEWLANETHDSVVIGHQVAIVYCEITGGSISKPTTIASDVLGEYNERLERLIDEGVAEALEDARAVQEDHTSRAAAPQWMT